MGNLLNPRPPPPTAELLIEKFGKDRLKQVFSHLDKNSRNPLFRDFSQRYYYTFPFPEGVYIPPQIEADHGASTVFLPNKHKEIPPSDHTQNIFLEVFELSELGFPISDLVSGRPYALHLMHLNRNDPIFELNEPGAKRAIIQLAFFPTPLFRKIIDEI